MLNKKDEQKQSNFQVFSTVVDISDKVLPIFTEKLNKEWVSYGDDNLFPLELITLYNKSGIHNAIIKSKVNMMLGDGLIQDENTVIGGEYSERTDIFIKNPNPYDNMDEIFRKCSLDFELFGLAYVEVIWSKDKKSIAEIYHIDASKIRWGRFGEENRLETLYYSRDWSNYRKLIYTPIEVPVFSDINRGGRQILPIITYSPGQDYYAYPDYVGALKWIEIDCEISNFHFNNLKNGMSPSIFFGFPVGATTEEERQKIEDKIIQKYRGTTNSGKFILAFYDAEGENKPEVQILEQTNADKQYDLLNKTTLQQILVGHKVVNENLVGIATPGKLGSAKEVLENYELYYNMVIKGQQKVILDAFNEIMLVNGMNDIEIVQNTPISINFSENIMKEILTQDEMREIIGYEPLEDEEETVVEEEETESGVTFKTMYGNGKVTHYTQYSYDFAGLRNISVSTSSADITQAFIDNPKDLYMWRLMNQKNPCPSCVGYANQTRTLDNWMRTAIPGHSSSSLSTTFTYTPYGTYCEAACRCRLVKIGKST